MFRVLIPELAGRFRVIAPDIPGFGQSAMPDPSEFDYTCDGVSAVIVAFAESLSLTRFAVYVFDYVPLWASDWL
jgi:pimeloyl-ACP methyl ester carboxylesterase